MIYKESLGMDIVVTSVTRLYNIVSSRLLVNYIQTAVEMTTQDEQINKCVRLCQEHFGGAWHRVIGSRVETSVKPLR